MNRAQGAAGLAFVLVAVAAGLWWGGREAEAPPALVGTTLVESPADARPLITVHVAGLVKTPGLVELADGSRVADAVAAAGGLLPGSNVEALNLAAVVFDGQQIVVSAVGPSSPATGVGGASEKIHLNVATATDLDALPGVGPVIAERIVSFRDEHGPFGSVEDLLDVPGIGEAKLADLRERVQVP